MPLWYTGLPPADNNSVASIDYANSLAAQNLTDASVKQTIKNRFSLATYASSSWAESIINNTNPNEAFARQSQLTVGLNTKIPVLGNSSGGTPLKSRANGPVALDDTGRVDSSLITRASAQTFPIMNWSPSSYSVVSNVTSETTICTLNVNPGLASYRVFVTGIINAKVVPGTTTSVDGQFARIHVRANSNSGQIVATGYGLAESYRGGVLTPIINPGNYSYQVPSWSNKIDVVLVGAGGGGINDSLGLSGAGGSGGSWAAATLVRGGNFSSGVLTINGSVGQGAPSENFNLFGYGNRRGGSTTCTPTGLAGVSAVGGATGGGTPGDPTLGGSPGNFSFAGNTYQGGPVQTNRGTNGNAPGGGGSGGNRSVGGAGANGAAYFYAYTNDDINYGQINVFPGSSNGPFSGPIVLYVNVLRDANGKSGAASITTSSLNPQISVMVVPA